MIKARRILLINGTQKAVLGPTPATALGFYNFGDDEPERGDIIEWDNGKSYAVVGRLWRPDGGYAVLARESQGYLTPALAHEAGDE
jgi:hypothetical protein